ncbi:hypothetical protein B0T16DRAFT_383848 [Cercophora newfieldiana]|uniref:Uncharacterized protein n=1 Tax=Cercophora newfieldiana TaxID=92897 RepID=A0AA40CZI3_9PEZI|nr:hypothetical protein B0T16DRAFT_383848 [Cercophora newfieldiana]
MDPTSNSAIAGALVPPHDDTGGPLRPFAADMLASNHNPLLTTAWFSKVHVILTQPCLKNLLMVSRNKDFGEAVQTLVVGVSFLRSDRVVDDCGHHHGRCEEWGNHEYNQALSNQEEMVASGLCTQYIAEALSSLSNLREIIVKDIYAVEAWGWATLRQRIGYGFMNNRKPDPDDELDVKFVWEAIGIMAMAILISDVPLQTFKVPIDTVDSLGEPLPCPGIFRHDNAMTRYMKHHQITNVRNLELVDLPLMHVEDDMPMLAQSTWIGDIATFFQGDSLKDVEISYLEWNVQEGGNTEDEIDAILRGFPMDEVKK